MVEERTLIASQMRRKPTVAAALLGLISLTFLLLLNGLDREPILESNRTAGSDSASSEPQGVQGAAFERVKTGYRSTQFTDSFLTRSEVGREDLKRPVNALDTDPVERIVQAALYDPDPEERKYAISELAMIDELSRLWVVCLRALEDRDHDVRLEAVLALENFGDRSLTVLQTVARSDPSMEVRDAALDTVESVQRPRPVLRSEEEAASR
jgi:hypothetical protein